MKLYRERTTKDFLWSLVLHTLCLCHHTVYHLVLVAGQRCRADGKVTVGLASHWPCVTDLSGLQGQSKRDEHPPTLIMKYATLYQTPWPGCREYSNTTRVVCTIRLLENFYFRLYFPFLPSFHRHCQFLWSTNAHFLM